MEFVEILERVSKISANLRERGITENEIHDFWINFISLIPIIKHRGVNNINVCTNCGTLDIDPVCENHTCCNATLLKKIA